VAPVNRELAIHIDGASQGNPGPAGIGLVLRPSDGAVQEVSEAIGSATRSQAEYQALVRGLELARSLGYRRIRVHSENLLLIRQMRQELRVRDPRLRPLYRQALTLAEGLQAAFVQISSQANRVADQLARRAAWQGQTPERRPVEEPITDEDHETSEAIQRSAGGVLYKKEGGTLMVCLIAKRGGIIWALPKGRVNPGETTGEAALREVLEETGHQASLGEQVAEIDYDFYWKENRTLYHKLVSFYLMPLVQEGAGTRDDEADAVGWFPMGEAWHKLSYLNEKEVLRQAWRILQMAGA